MKRYFALPSHSLIHQDQEHKSTKCAAHRVLKSHKARIGSCDVPIQIQSQHTNTVAVICKTFDRRSTIVSQFVNRTTQIMARNVCLACRMANSSTLCTRFGCTYTRLAVEADKSIKTRKITSNHNFQCHLCLLLATDPATQQWSWFSLDDKNRSINQVEKLKYEQ